MYTKEEIATKKAEIETQWQNLIKMSEEKKVQFENDIQAIRDAQNEIRGKYSVFDEMEKELAAAEASSTVEEKETKKEKK